MSFYTNNEWGASVSNQFFSHFDYNPGMLKGSESDLLIQFRSRLLSAIQARGLALENGFMGVTRLFTGFTEGEPGIVLELFGKTLVIHNHKKPSQSGLAFVNVAMEIAREALPQIETVLLKDHHAPEFNTRRGQILFGKQLQQQVNEFGVHYVLDLTLNQDASFFPDTRNVRAWLLTHAAGLQVCNLFAYSGTLGVAALAGKAGRVVQVDRNARFLNLAARSAALNRIPKNRQVLIAEDFFTLTAQYRQNETTFDIVILDPPFFSETKAGRVDQAQETERAINKARPLVRDGGRLIVINNALFLSGAEFMHKMEALSIGGFIKIEEIIPVPEDCTGYPVTRVGVPAIDPAPFNHPTKIVILQIKRK